MSELRLLHRSKMNRVMLIWVLLVLSQDGYKNVQAFLSYKKLGTSIGDRPSLGSSSFNSIRSFPAGDNLRKDLFGCKIFSSYIGTLGCRERNGIVQRTNLQRSPSRSTSLRQSQSSVNSGAITTGGSERDGDKFTLPPPANSPNGAQKLLRALLFAICYPKRKLDSTMNNMRTFFDSKLPMLHYLWPEDDFRLRAFLVLSIVAMFMGKWFNLKVPFILQRTIDAISNPGTSAAGNSKKLLSSASIAIIYYGMSRALSVVCSEVKTCLFTHVSQNVLRKFANQIFSHLHSLDSAFHVRTPSGVISVAYVRAVRGFQALLFQIIFSVAPTLLELTMVSSILYRRFGPAFAAVTLATFSLYLAFTVKVTQWRVAIRTEMVDTDNARNGFFIDSILNHEIVKLFTNEKRELEKFDGYLEKIQKLSIDNTYAIAVLNLGQALLFSAGLTTSLFLAMQRVRMGTMSVGDLVAINSMLLQLAIPFNFMGYTYQELRQSLVDMGYISELLVDQGSSVQDSPHARPFDEIVAESNMRAIKDIPLPADSVAHRDVNSSSSNRAGAIDTTAEIGSIEDVESNEDVVDDVDDHGVGAIVGGALDGTAKNETDRDGLLNTESDLDLLQDHSEGKGHRHVSTGHQHHHDSLGKHDADSMGEQGKMQEVDAPKITYDSTQGGGGGVIDSEGDSLAAGRESLSLAGTIPRDVNTGRNADLGNEDFENTGRNNDVDSAGDGDKEKDELSNPISISSIASAIAAVFNVTTTASFPAVGENNDNEDFTLLYQSNSHNPAVAGNTLTAPAGGVMAVESNSHSDSNGNSNFKSGRGGVKRQRAQMVMKARRPPREPSSLEFRNVTFQYSDATKMLRRMHKEQKLRKLKQSQQQQKQLSQQGGGDGSGVLNNLESEQRLGDEEEEEDATEGMLLKNVSFKIEKGQNVAIVGPSGSGKSTTLKLITRMLDPVEGEILLDGVNLRDATIHSLRQRISVVPQDTSLFDETILYNLMYGNDAASAEEVAAAITSSNLQQTVQKFPEGLLTKVGERGARLSGGERQKVSIARAILKNPTLILCDEVTSAVDAFAEREIVETLRLASENRTTITIAHRLSSIVLSDKIIVLNKGRMCEQGTHEELMKLGPEKGVYRRMWDAQHSYTRGPGGGELGDEPMKDFGVINSYSNSSSGNSSSGNFGSDRVFIAKQGSYDIAGREIGQGGGGGEEGGEVMTEVFVRSIDTDYIDVIADDVSFTTEASEVVAATAAAAQGTEREEREEGKGAERGILFTNLADDSVANAASKDIDNSENKTAESSTFLYDGGDTGFEMYRYSGAFDPDAAPTADADADAAGGLGFVEAPHTQPQQDKYDGFYKYNAAYYDYNDYEYDFMDHYPVANYKDTISDSSAIGGEGDSGVGTAAAQDRYYSGEYGEVVEQRGTQRPISGKGKGKGMPVSGMRWATAGLSGQRVEEAAIGAAAIQQRIFERQRLARPPPPSSSSPSPISLSSQPAQTRTPEIAAKSDDIPQKSDDSTGSSVVVGAVGDSAQIGRAEERRDDEGMHESVTRADDFDPETSGSTSDSTGGSRYDHDDNEDSSQEEGRLAGREEVAERTSIWTDLFPFAQKKVERPSFPEELRDLSIRNEQNEPFTTPADGVTAVTAAGTAAADEETQDEKSLSASDRSPETSRGDRSIVLASRAIPGGRAGMQEDVYGEEKEESEDIDEETGRPVLDATPITLRNNKQQQTRARAGENALAYDSLNKAGRAVAVMDVVEEQQELFSTLAFGMPEVQYKVPMEAVDGGGSGSSSSGFGDSAGVGISSDRAITGAASASGSAPGASSASAAAPAPVAAAVQAGTTGSVPTASSTGGSIVGSSSSSSYGGVGEPIMEPKWNPSNSMSRIFRSSSGAASSGAGSADSPGSSMGAGAGNTASTAGSKMADGSSSGSSSSGSRLDPTAVIPSKYSASIQEAATVLSPFVTSRRMRESEKSPVAEGSDLSTSSSGTGGEDESSVEGGGERKDIETETDVETEVSASVSKNIEQFAADVIAAVRGEPSTPIHGGETAERNDDDNVSGEATEGTVAAQGQEGEGSGANNGSDKDEERIERGQRKHSRSGSSTQDAAFTSGGSAESSVEDHDLSKFRKTGSVGQGSSDRAGDTGFAEGGGEMGASVYVDSAGAGEGAGLGARDVGSSQFPEQMHPTQTVVDPNK